MSEDPGVVFSVKELIGRLEGKLDTTANMLATKLDVLGTTLADKADRSDLATLGDRVTRMEGAVSDLHQRELERDAAQVASERAKSQVETKHQDNHRFAITVVIAIVSALAAIVLAAVAALGH